MWRFGEMNATTSQESQPVVTNYAACLAKCRLILGGESDPFASEWRDMGIDERRFWLSSSRLPLTLAAKDAWGDVPGDARAKLKNSLYRAAMRAKALLPPSANV
jgi:hypothetical protein